jgi:hypothetical protein
MSRARYLVDSESFPGGYAPDAEIPMAFFAPLRMFESAGRIILLEIGVGMVYTSNRVVYEFGLQIGIMGLKKYPHYINLWQNGYQTRGVRWKNN